MDRIPTEGPSTNIAKTIETTKSIVLNSISTSRKFSQFPSDGEILIKTFNDVLEARQKVWENTNVSEHDQHQEIQETETLTLYHSLGGTDIANSLPSDLFSQPQELIPRMQRKLLRIYEKSPDLVRSIVKLPIIGGHGSRSGSLVNTLIHGLRPTDYQKDSGIHSLNGTYDWGGNNFNRSAVSFACLTNDRDLIHFSGRPAINILNIDGWMRSYEKEYNQPDLNPTRKTRLDWAKRLSDFIAKPNKTDKEADTEKCLMEDFPVIYLIDREATDLSKPYSVDSTISEEFAIDGGVAPESIPMILVPEKNIATVQEMAKKYGWDGAVMDIKLYTNEEP